MSDASYWSIFVNAALVNNFVLAYFLGICPFFGVSARLETALRMGGAVSFVMLVASVCAYSINLLLDLVNAPYLRIISYILVIASTVQLVEMLIRKLSPATFRAMGIYLPLITTNCAILGDKSRLRIHTGCRICARCGYGIRPGPRTHGRSARETRPGQRARPCQRYCGRAGRGRYSVHELHGLCGARQMNPFVDFLIATMLITVLVLLRLFADRRALQRRIRGDHTQFCHQEERIEEECKSCVSKTTR